MCDHNEKYIEKHLQATENFAVSISGVVFTNLELKNNQRAWCLRECMNCLNLSINLLASSMAIYNVRNPNVCGFGLT